MELRKTPVSKAEFLASTGGDAPFYPGGSSSLRPEVFLSRILSKALLSWHSVSKKAVEAVKENEGELVTDLMLSLRKQATNCILAPTRDEVKFFYHLEAKLLEQCRDELYREKCVALTAAFGFNKCSPLLASVERAIADRILSAKTFRDFLHMEQRQLGETLRAAGKNFCAFPERARKRRGRQKKTDPSDAELLISELRQCFDVCTTQPNSAQHSAVSIHLKVSRPEPLRGLKAVSPLPQAVIPACHTRIVASSEICIDAKVMHYVQTIQFPVRIIDETKGKLTPISDDEGGEPFYEAFKQSALKSGHTRSLCLLTLIASLQNVRDACLLPALFAECGEFFRGLRLVSNMIRESDALFGIQASSRESYKLDVESGRYFVETGRRFEDQLEQLLQEEIIVKHILPRLSAASGDLEWVKKCFKMELTEEEKNIVDCLPYAKEYCDAIVQNFTKLRKVLSEEEKYNIDNQLQELQEGGGEEEDEEEERADDSPTEETWAAAVARAEQQRAVLESTISQSLMAKGKQYAYFLLFAKFVARRPFLLWVPNVAVKSRETWVNLEGGKINFVDRFVERGELDLIVLDVLSQIVVTIVEVKKHPPDLPYACRQRNRLQEVLQTQVQHESPATVEQARKMSSAPLKVQIECHVKPQYTWRKLQNILTARKLVDTQLLAEVVAPERVLRSLVTFQGGSIVPLFPLGTASFCHQAAAMANPRLNWVFVTQDTAHFQKHLPIPSKFRHIFLKQIADIVALSASSWCSSFVAEVNDRSKCVRARLQKAISLFLADEERHPSLICVDHAKHLCGRFKSLIGKEMRVTPSPQQMFDDLQLWNLLDNVKWVCPSQTP